MLSENIKKFIEEAKQMKTHIGKAHFKDTKTVSNMEGDEGGNNIKGSPEVGGDDKKRRKKMRYQKSWLRLLFVKNQIFHGMMLLV